MSSEEFQDFDVFEEHTTDCANVNTGGEAEGVSTGDSGVASSEADNQEKNEAFAQANNDAGNQLNNAATDKAVPADLQLDQESGSAASSSQAPHPYMAQNKSFARRTRHMNESLEHTLEEHGKQYMIPVQPGIAPTAVAEDSKPISYRKIFQRKALVRVEIGSGVGTQIVAAAHSHPDRDYIAFEVYRPGLAKTIRKAEALGGLPNLKLIEADAQQALRLLLPEASVDEVWTFFPDPWRKTRHHKRRLIQEDFARDVAYVLRPGGLWRIATDWDDYAWSIRDVIESSAYFENPYTGVNPDPRDPEGDRGGFAPRWDNRVMTKFEHRGIEAGRTIHDIVGQRL
ncbi:MAG: tRNA (guanosine(46)-N7)-methyltransferase TrmB [Actinomycetaceae bacterium]|nr:tRNA (guanosine(46)-N7)-methyltransferase TrmB [Actinomycetaceae bacterium]